VLGPIISIESQLSTPFRPASNTVNPANPANLNLAAIDLQLDVNMRKWVSTNFGWVSSKSSAAKASRGVKAADSSADSSAVNDEMLRELLLKDLSIPGKKTLSSREQHEYIHWLALEPWTLSDAPYAKMNKIMLQRCKDRYLFDCEKNREILSDDRWLQDVWLWIEGLLNQAAL
jgi:hypothetical protein